MTRAYLRNYEEYVFEISRNSRNQNVDIVWPDNPDLLDLGPRLVPAQERLLSLGWIIKCHLGLLHTQFPELFKQKGHESPEECLEVLRCKLSNQINSDRVDFLWGILRVAEIMQSHENRMQLYLRGKIEELWE